MELKTEQKTKKKTWMRLRHKVVTAIAFCVVYPWACLKYNVQIHPFRERGKRPYLVLLNHQTPFDQFFVGISFRRAMYYLATEDIFSMGWISKLIRWLVAPIPIKKQTTDVSAVMTCIRVAREGGSIVIAPEGNRTYSGRTCYMNPAIAGLAKKLKMPIALYRIEGGYGAEPRWSDKVRRGRMEAYVSRVIEPEEYAAMTPAQLMAEIEAGLRIDENKIDIRFRSNRRAEYLERLVYVCPKCGLATFESHGNTVTCKTCGLTAVYGEDKTFTGDHGAFPFRFVGQWYDYQEAFVNALDLTQYEDRPMFRDTACLSEVIVYQNKHKLRENAAVALYGNRIVIDEGSAEELCFPFAETGAVTVLGRNKLNIYHGERVWQLKGSKRFNALKYVNIFHRHRNLSRGDEHGKFLGL